MRDLVAGVALIVVFSFLLVAAAQLHPFGEPSSQEIDKYYLEETQPELGANNVVTAVVFDYRGFDTLGEATVLFAAVAGVFMIFWGRSK